jgi:hypothetical protein
MKTYRLWFARALVLLAICGALLMLGGIPGTGSLSGPVWGSVRVNGRPLMKGAVLFVPIAERDCPWASAPIARDGSFSVDREWPRPGTTAARYKICIIPDRRRNVTGLKEHGERRLPHVVPASFSPGSPGSPDGDEDLGVPQRFRTPQTTNLEVNLSQEPARIDIDLRD